MTRPKDAPEGETPESRATRAELKRTVGNLRDLIRCWEHLTERGRREHIASMADKLERRLGCVVEPEDE